MTNLEFSSEFDILYNNVSSNQSPGFDEYEKAVFLTQAQEEIVKDIYSGRLLTGFEDTEEARRYLDKLIVTSRSNQVTKENTIHLPDDVLFITLEKAHIKSVGVAEVIPVTQDAFFRTINNPFRRPTNKRVLRADFGAGKLTLIPPKDKVIESYTLTYLRKPKPILLDIENTFFEGESSIDNYPTQKERDAYKHKDDSQEEEELKEYIMPLYECELDSALHREILKRAVLLAKASFDMVPKQ